ncbi:MAG: tetratricopeptide repeat protein [Thermoanaerobaculia bacterium]|nr:tetratricopeptide repeat protein [Thermoanaerobaculia bacterium]
MLLGRILLSSADPDGAAQAYRKVLERGPTHRTARISLGMAHQRSERWDEAFAAFEEVLENRPDDRHALYQLGRTGALSGRNLERSEQALRSFIAGETDDDPKSYRGGALWRLGMVLEHRGDQDGARASYRKALERDPDLSDAREALQRLERGS